MWKKIKDIGKKIKEWIKESPIIAFTILFFITVAGSLVASSEFNYFTWTHDRHDNKECTGSNKKECVTNHHQKHSLEILGVTLVDAEHDQTPNHDSTVEPNKDIDSFLYFVSGAASLGLLIVAFSQFTLLNRTNKNTELLQIDKRWASKEIIIARQIIHAIYRQINQNGECNNSCCKNEAYYLTKKVKNFYKDAQKVGKILYALSNSQDDNMQRAFIYIQHYIDLMESLAFIYKDADDDELKEVSALVGDSIIFNYFMFKGFIDCCNEYIPTESTMRRYRFLPCLVKKTLEKDTNLKDKTHMYTNQFDTIICDQIKSDSKKFLLNDKDPYVQKIKEILKSNNA